HYRWFANGCRKLGPSGPILHESSNAGLRADQGALEDLFERVADAMNLLRSHAREKRQRQRAVGDVFGDGKIAGLEAELLAHVRLEMNRREVIVATDAGAAQLVHDMIAIAGAEQVVQANDENEPAHVIAVGERRQDQVAVG